VAMIGVLHHPEDVAGLIEREIALTSDAPLDEGFLEPEEAAYVA
jgi:hypothetical protein